MPGVERAEPIEMSDEGKQAWMKVGLHFAAVGEKLKEHGKRATGDSPASKPDDVDQAAVTDALNTLGRAIDQAVSSVSGAVQDPEVRDGLKSALDSMGEALNESFADAGDTAGDKLKYAGDKLKGAFGKKPDGPTG
jgi:hypothetical protein